MHLGLNNYTGLGYTGQSTTFPIYGPTTKLENVQYLSIYQYCIHTCIHHQTLHTDYRTISGGGVTNLILVAITRSTVTWQNETVQLTSPSVRGLSVRCGPSHTEDTCPVNRP